MHFSTEMVNCLKPYIISNIILINVHMVSVLTGTSSVIPEASSVDRRPKEFLQLSIRGHQTHMLTAA